MSALYTLMFADLDDFDEMFEAKFKDDSARLNLLNISETLVKQAASELGYSVKGVDISADPNKEAMLIELQRTLEWSQSPQLSAARNLLRELAEFYVQLAWVMAKENGLLHQAVEAVTDSKVADTVVYKWAGYEFLKEMPDRDQAGPTTTVSAFLIWDRFIHNVKMIYMSILGFEQRNTPAAQKFYADMVLRINSAFGSRDARKNFFTDIQNGEDPYLKRNVIMA